MKFTLTYAGDLKSKGTAADKHRIRSELHPQLAWLWQHEPLKGHTNWYTKQKPSKLGIDLNRKVGEFNFVPLIARSNYLVCSLKVFMLRTEAPGRIVCQGGDIDNRLKTLLDALRVPTNASELPRGVKPEDGQDPFFCLLDDDSLVTALAVETDRLLVPPTRAAQVSLFIQVEARATRVLVNNTFIGDIGLV